MSSSSSLVKTDERQGEELWLKLLARGEFAYIKFSISIYQKAAKHDSN